MKARRVLWSSSTSRIGDRGGRAGAEERDSAGEERTQEQNDDNGATFLQRILTEDLVQSAANGGPRRPG